MRRLPPPTPPNPLAAEDEGEEARASSLAAVGAHADPTWMGHALALTEDLAHRLPQMTSDEIWEALDDYDVETHDNRAMGAVMTEAGRRGWLHRTEQTILSRRAVNHRRPVRVWQSLVYAESDLLPPEPDGPPPGSTSPGEGAVGDDTPVNPEVKSPDTQVAETWDIGTSLGATEVDALPEGDESWSSGTEAAIEKAAVQMAAMRAVAGQNRRVYYLMACPEHGYWLLSTGPGGIEKTSTWMGCCATCRRAEPEDQVRQIIVPSFPKAPLLGREELTKIKELEAEAVEPEAEEAGEPDESEAEEAGGPDPVALVISLPPPRRRVG